MSESSVEKLVPFVPLDVLELATTHENRILALVDGLEAYDAVDKRWLAIARTDIEKGFMACKRAIFSGRRVTDQKE